MTQSFEYLCKGAAQYKEVVSAPNPRPCRFNAVLDNVVYTTAVGKNAHVRVGRGPRRG